MSIAACLSVCMREYFMNYATKLHQCVHVWPWLGPLLAALQNVTYFQFYAQSNVSSIGPYVPEHACKLKLTDH